jgi:glucuronyl/N-acetylglucosaminyl transferase EXT2
MGTIMKQIVAVGNMLLRSRNGRPIFHSRDITCRLQGHRRKFLLTSLKAFCKKYIYSFLASFAFIFLLIVHMHLLQVFLRHEIQLRQEFSTINNNNSTWINLMNRKLSPLRQTDYEFYTIRINSWKRLDQLLESIRHHSSCPGAVQIQVVWCLEQGEPPSILGEFDKVVIENHAINSLNERFHLLQQPPTLGVLSMDDDVLRSCAAIDSGFFKWTQNPHRMVGFDGRSHSVSFQDGKKIWKYAYLSETVRTNRYSISLPRYAFLHRDYLDWYMTDLPRAIFDRVQNNFNCEDIAMSFFVSALTNGKPPLLADKWASIGSQVKLYNAMGGISATGNHKALRDSCVNDFSDILNLKGKLLYGKYVGSGLFSCGDNPQYLCNEAIREKGILKCSRQIEFDAMRSAWQTMSQPAVMKTMVEMKINTTQHAYWNGLIEGSEPWEKRWKQKKNEKKTMKVKTKQAISLPTKEGDKGS